VETPAWLSCNIMWDGPERLQLRCHTPDGTINSGDPTPAGVRSQGSPRGTAPQGLEGIGFVDCPRPGKYRFEVQVHGAAPAGSNETIAFKVHKVMGGHTELVPFTLGPTVSIWTVWEFNIDSPVAPEASPPASTVLSTKQSERKKRLEGLGLSVLLKQVEQLGVSPARVALALDGDGAHPKDALIELILEERPPRSTQHNRGGATAAEQGGGVPSGQLGKAEWLTPSANATRRGAAAAAAAAGPSPSQPISQQLSLEVEEGRPSQQPPRGGGKAAQRRASGTSRAAAAAARREQDGASPTSTPPSGGGGRGGGRSASPRQPGGSSSSGGASPGGARSGRPTVGKGAGSTSQRPSQGRRSPTGAARTRRSASPRANVHEALHQSPIGGAAAARTPARAASPRASVDEAVHQPKAAGRACMHASTAAVNLSSYSGGDGAL
jgi:hypothetical protein